MNCLDNIIGIRGCGLPEPTSGLYIQDLAGMRLSIANAAVDNETISGVELIREKIKYAQNEILNEARNILKDKIRVNSLIESDVVGYYKKDLKGVPVDAGKLTGIKVKIEQNQNLELFISNIYLKVNHTGDVPVYIYDLNSGQLIDTIDVSCTPGVTGFSLVNKSFKTNRQRLSLFIGYDASIQGYESSVSKPSGCGPCENYYNNRYVKFSSGKIDQASPKIDSNVKSGSGTAGLSFEYSVSCSLESFICSMAGLLAWPLLHKVGVEIMAEVINSKRLNSIVLLDKQQSKDLRSEYEEKYKSAMDGLFHNIKLPNDVCFSCNSRIKSVVSIP